MRDFPSAGTIESTRALKDRTGSLAHTCAFGYDNARYALPRPGGPGPRDPREWSAGDPPGVLPGASSDHRTDPTRTSRGSRGLRPEPPSTWRLPAPLRRHLYPGRPPAAPPPHPRP